MTEPLDVEVIKQRVDAASPGKWFAVRDDEDGMGAVQNREGEIVSESYETGDGDLAFIAHARQDIPALLTALREAEQRERTVNFALSLATKAVATREWACLGTVNETIQPLVDAFMGALREAQEARRRAEQDYFRALDTLREAQEENKRLREALVATRAFLIRIDGPGCPDCGVGEDDHASDCTYEYRLDQIDAALEAKR